MLRGEIEQGRGLRYHILLKFFDITNLLIVWQLVQESFYTRIKVFSNAWQIKSVLKRGKVSILYDQHLGDIIWQCTE